MTYMATHIAIAVVEHEGRYLAQQRPPGVPLAGFYEFPGGKIEPGETAEAAAVRECLEETGIPVRIIGEYPAVEHSYQHGTLHLRFFACAAIDIMHAKSHIIWATREGLDSLPFPPATIPLLRQIARTN